MLGVHFSNNYYCLDVHDVQGVFAHDMVVLLVYCWLRTTKNYFYQVTKNNLCNIGIVVKMHYVFC